MGEPLSPDCVFNFPMDEPDLHPAYDFFAPGPLPGYAGIPNNNNGWIEADVPLVGRVELEERRAECSARLVMTLLSRDSGDGERQQYDDSGGIRRMRRRVWEVNEDVVDGSRHTTLNASCAPLSTYEGKGRSIYCCAATGQSFTYPAPLDFLYRAGRRGTRRSRVSKLRPKGMSRESTLMQCILGMDRRLADLERRPPGPQ
ncbi:hypothetical protein Tco_0920815 [Tanacetum coccineum]